MTRTLANLRLIDPEAGTETPGWLRIDNGRIAEYRVTLDVTFILED